MSALAIPYVTEHRNWIGAWRSCVCAIISLDQPCINETHARVSV